MEGNIKLGTIWGIPIGLHLSWFVIFILLVWSLSTSYFPQEYPQLNSVIYVLLGIITAVLFFASVLAHELGHSWVALRNKIPVKKITLFIFGGVAQIGQEPRSAGVEFWVAVAGPLVSLALGLLFGGIWLLDQGIPTLAAPSLYLMRINLMLALFNMIPGFPLDGGRVLRALVWKFTGSFPRATRVASITGQVVAFGFIGLGFIAIFGGNLMNGLWLAFIGWFLQNAAASAYSQTALPNLLHGIKVGQVMARECTRVTSLTPLSQLVDERVLNGGERCFIIADNGKLEGMLTLRDIAQIPQPKWRFTTTGQVMVPFTRLVRVNPETELLSALQTMDDANVAQVPVVSGDELVGMLSREQVVHYLRTRAELGI